MKKILTLFLSLSMIFALSACGSQNSGNNAANTRSDGESIEAAETSTEEPTGASTETPTETSTEEAAEEPVENVANAEGKILVVYYSATGNTQEAANYIAAATGADMFELVPAEPYSDADLNWTDDNSRVVYEHENPDARVVELVESTVSDWESYDTVFIGFPNWWYDMPMVMYSFFDEYDFSGKTIIPFNVHNGSRFSGTISTIKELEPDAAVIEDGFTVSERDVADAAGDVAEWLDGLGY